MNKVVKESASHAGVTLVTGGASGMGLLLTKKLAARGDKIAVADVNPLPADDAIASNPGVTAFICDMSDTAAVENMVAEISSRLGEVTRLIHCAAIMPAGDLSEMEATQTNRVMAINYMGTVNITRTVLPGMLARDAGAIAVIGSMAGSVLTHGMGAYCASKAATNTYMEVLQEENRHNKVQILLICPPMVNTPLVDQALDGGPKSLGLAKSTNRMASPESIVDAILGGLENGASTVRPGEAGFMMWLRRFSPALLWWIMRKANAR
ncbi:SDR family NAD(P)-dependent oxidoreductase [Pseudohalioglobus sediminis]|uniref:SDR family NAD(P)-dependent oxidoreductase n=1 Tax=Pseudohalioglobus sediminis TaxID=2606449 RepID=A0A5B0WZV3_9GAMM|nr:SDR family NAD(P)-dependent oxidoreductase [Pseudohalioglobus sediminis]KAA1191925.1 SDR family NAD(P)-dependent oxidoreductase [Pseudohalioglobus sediminis]